MSEYRVRSSGELKNQGEIRKLHPNTSIPKVWDANVCDSLGIDPVFVSPQPTPSGDYKRVVRNGAVEDGGNWVQAWLEQDMFVTDSDGTKAEKEAAYQATLDATAAELARSNRDAKLALTDWRAGSDLTLTSEWATYRQALRDIPGQAGFPHEVTWPDSP
jgi:hypothetical protein